MFVQLCLYGYVYLTVDVVMFMGLCICLCICGCVYGGVCIHVFMGICLQGYVYYTLFMMQCLCLCLQIEGETTGTTDERESKLFPDKDVSQTHITCHDITPEFLIFGTDVSQWLHLDR